MIFFRGIEIFGASIRRTAEISLRQWKINSVIGARARSKVIPVLDLVFVIYGTDTMVKIGLAVCDLWPWYFDMSDLLFVISGLDSKVYIQ